MNRILALITIPFMAAIGVIAQLSMIPGDKTTGWWIVVGSIIMSTMTILASFSHLINNILGYCIAATWISGFIWMIYVGYVTGNYENQTPWWRFL
jgi:hypothetical protein